MHYDLLVVGTGGGGKLIVPAAKKGLKVAVCEKGAFGGTCLNCGCIPSKMLIHASSLIETYKHMEQFEWQMPANAPVMTDAGYQALIRYVQDVVQKDSHSILPRYHTHGIDVFQGHARFIGPKRCVVDGQQITADKIVLATGAQPHVPSIPGLAATPYTTYQTFFQHTKKPKSVLILGGGYIATELGGFLAQVGVETTFVVRSSFLRHEDVEVQALFDTLFSQGKKVLKHTTVEHVAYNDGQFTVQTSQGTYYAEQLLVATGVAPATDLDLDKGGIATDTAGFITVDTHLQTTAEGVWAFGDCIGRYLFRHNANFEGEYLYQHLLEEQQGSIHYPPMPHAVFTTPQIASVGVTEQACRPGAYYKGVAPLVKSAMGMAHRTLPGFVKLLFDRATDQLIGAHCIGGEASSLIHEPIAWITMGARLQDLQKAIYVHPSINEVVRNSWRQALLNKNTS